MKKLAYFFTIALLGACAPTSVNVEPTPFVPSSEKVIVVGCEQLRKEIDDWNKSNPTNTRVADC